MADARTAQELADECQRISDRPMSVLMNDDRNAIREAAAELRRVAALASQAEPVAIPDECPHMIVFDDTDREPLMFAGAGARAAALHAWKAVSAQWNAHLFVRIERNTRDDRHPCATIAAPPAPAQAEQSEEAVRRGIQAALDGKPGDTWDSIVRRVLAAAQPEQSEDGRDAARWLDAVRSAEHLCPLDMSHPDKLRWKASYIRAAIASKEQQS